MTLLTKIKIGMLIALFLLFSITRYYHSFYGDPKGYGTGDAFGVILNSRIVEESKENNYLVSYYYRIAHEISGISFYRISFFYTPIIGLIIILFIFNLLKRKYNYLAATLGSYIIILNPWLSYHTTEPSKEIFVLLFVISSFYCLIRYKETNITKWLVFSFFFYTVGISFYHSILLFFPFYFSALLIILLSTYKGLMLFRKFVLYGVLLIGMIIFFAGPQYYLKEVNYRKIAAEKNEILKTEIDEEGNVFERQFGAMYYALIEDRSKLGLSNLNKGVSNFLLGRNEIVYVFIASLVISVFLLTKRNYTLFTLTLLTSYIFIIVGIQWTSYSHASRYPQYIVYFLLTAISIFIFLGLNLLKNTRLRIASISMLIIILFFIFNPFLKVDQYRELYAHHKKIGLLMREKNINIDSNNQLLFLGWPSITLSLLENNEIRDSSKIHTFGFGLINLNGISSREYITDNKINYYIYDKSGSDYFDSSNIVRDNLNKNFSLKQIARIQGKYGENIIYKINIQNEK